MVALLSTLIYAFISLQTIEICSAAQHFRYYSYCNKVHLFRDPYSNEEVASSAFCAMLDIPPLLYEFSSIVFFVVPMVSLVVMYSMMGWRVVTTARRRQSLMTGDSSNTQGRERTKKAVIEMLGNRLCFYSALLSIFLDFQSPSEIYF